MYRLLTISFLIFLFAGCYSESEKALITNCAEEYYSRGWYNKDTGEEITQSSDALLYSHVISVCSVKVDMYQDGFRVSPYIETRDMDVYLFDESSGLRSYHKEKLKCEAEPDSCNSNISTFDKVIIGLIGILLVIVVVRFWLRLYSSYKNKSNNSIAALIVATVGAIGTPGSFVLLIWAGNFLDGLPTILTLVWWLGSCYAPYYIYTRICRFAGYDIGS